MIIMSRSYKKHPICTDQWTGKKLGKKWANRRVRKDTEVYNNKQYRKLYDSYLIADYCSYWTEEEARKWYRLHKDTYDRYYKDEDEYIREVWFPCYKRK